MYTEKDYAEICAQLKQRLVAVITPAAVLLIMMFVSFFLRWAEGVTAALCIAGGLVLIFGISMFVKPVYSYRQHIYHALHGRTRKTTGVFVEQEDEPVLRDGVFFRAVTINVGEQHRDDGDRLFYFDANLPRVDWQTEDMLTITSYDGRMTAWEKA